MGVNGSMADAYDTAYIGGELDLFALARNWKGYVRREIADYLKGDVLEVGAGIGGTTEALHNGSVSHWVCLEPDATLAACLQARLLTFTNASKISVVIGSVESFASPACFDCILYVDVLEHIDDDLRQIETASRLLRPGGHIIILAPAHHWLYSEFDKSIGHLRRYNKVNLSALIPKGWMERKLIYLDSVGILLSLCNVVALRQSIPTERQILTWDRICVPVSRLIDRLLRGKVGKSVLAVWQKR
jgi:SAM-dependent methyltransferase